jgi:hypothetical protein
MAQATSLSSTGQSGAIILNPVSKSTTLVLTLSSSAASVVDIQGSADDPTILGGPTTTWATISSATAMSGATLFDARGYVLTVLTPLGGVRINSTSAAGTYTLKALQSVTA